MSDPLDMSLDDLIQENKQSRGQKCKFIPRNLDRSRPRPGSGFGYGPTRRFRERGSTITTPYSPSHGFVKQAMYRRKEAGTRLYVSNLHYEVSDDDIKVLFSDVGELKNYGIHYDESGRSKGTAEVVFAKEADALTAIKRYNHLQLDGRPLKIDFIGVEVATPSKSPPYGMWRRSGAEQVAAHRRKDEGRSHGFGKGERQGRRHVRAVSAEDLDADLEMYHFKSMHIN